jgi:arylsulfatase A-like enzyme
MAQQTRRQFLKTMGSAAVSAGALSLCAGCAGAGPSAGTGRERPNVILIMTDDQGWGDVAYNGHPALRTPNLDQMAGEGMRFERFYSGAPVCSPTRCSCLTGRHPFRYGIYHANVGHMKKEEITLAEVLRMVG